MRVVTDDDVYRYQGRLIEVRGSVAWWQLRYVTWLVLAIACPVGVALLYLLGVVVTGFLSTWMAVVLGLMLGGAITFRVMDMVDEGRSLLSVIDAITQDGAAWIRARRQPDTRIRRLRIPAAALSRETDTP